MLPNCNKTSSRIACIGGAVLALMFLSACHPEGEKNPLSREPHRQIQPRNPDTDNHETLRILNRDDAWRLTDMVIYKLEGEINILKNPVDGNNTGGSVDLEKGPKFSVTADESGKHALKAELKAPNGGLIVSQERIDKGTVKSIVPLNNGSTAELINHDEGNERIITVRQDNGTPVFEVRMRGLRRIGMKLYSATGRILYEETQVEPENEFEPAATGTVYVGVIHGPPDGRVTHRVKIRQFASQDDPGSLDIVETIGDDGTTVTATADTRWDDEKSVACGVFGDQKGLQSKLQEVFGSVKLIMDANMQLDRLVVTLLQDKTR